VPSADRPAPSLPDVSHDLSFLSSSCIQQASDGPEQPLETSPPAEDPIALLRIQLEEQRAEHKSWKASVEERLGKLEREGKAVAAEEVIVMIPPDAREAAVEQPTAHRTLLKLHTRTQHVERLRSQCRNKSSCSAASKRAGSAMPTVSIFPPRALQ
jgi:hypothetical protein